ncbi:MAG: hypothetical protein KAT68_18440 [Bacteroidales bacterium]|nr:hypothetical protein [Bacteroidales bacterium]
MSFENIIEILKLAVSFVTPIIILVLGIIINRKIEKGKLLLLKDKEWQVKWADLFFKEAIVFNNLVTESVSLINKLSNLPLDKTDEINSIIEILSNEKFPMLEKVEWNIKNYVQLSDNKNNIEKLLLLQEEIFREIGNLKNEGSISFERVRSKQLDYNKLAREIHNEIMNYKK